MSPLSPWLLVVPDALIVASANDLVIEHRVPDSGVVASLYRNGQYRHKYYRDPRANIIMMSRADFKEVLIYDNLYTFTYPTPRGAALQSNTCYLVTIHNPLIQTVCTKGLQSIPVQFKGT